MYILGISSYAHESSCALVKDGSVRVLLEEERFNRKKHTWEYPRRAIEEALRFEGIGIGDVEKIAFFWVPAKEFLGNAAHMLRYFPASLRLLSGVSGGGMPFLARVKAMSDIGNEVRRHFGLRRAPDVVFVEHHLAHAASAFFLSGFKEAAILTIDGRGESTSTMMAEGHDNRILKIKEIKAPHSLGHLYAAVTWHLGFRPFFDEWKVMGMSAYGTDAFEDDFKDLLRLTDDGGYRLNLKYFQFHTHGQKAWVSRKFLSKFGPARKSDGPYEQRHFDIAYALQKAVERAGVHLACELYSRTQLPNLCMAGGVVLNCLMNARIAQDSPFKEFFFQPIANDAGTSLGSALYYYHQVNGFQPGRRLDSLYLGTDYSNEEIEKALSGAGVSFRKCDDIAREAALLIARGKIVGWFQGRMEAGPRALGNRSITVSPLDPAMKERLNERVKKREFFRPFAPSVLEEKAAEYFEIPRGMASPYMIITGKVKEEKRGVIPAVTHADGTARVHTVNKDVNPRFWRLIREFEKLTGVPVLLNTSFNENEPIVCTPADAVSCFLRTEFDCLAIGDYLATKP